jgi:hypothetical protein
MDRACQLSLDWNSNIWQAWLDWGAITMDKELSLATEAGVRAFMNESVFAFCAEIIGKSGEIMPTAHVICRIHPETKKRMDKPGIVTMVCPDMCSESGKDAWTSAIRKTASKLAACGVILINEAWMVMAEKDVDITKIRPSESPNRIEVVMVVLEHIAAGKEMWMANIIREENSPPCLTEFKKSFSSKDEDHTGYAGRFTGLIPETNPSVN